MAKLKLIDTKEA